MTSTSSSYHGRRKAFSCGGNRGFFRGSQKDFCRGAKRGEISFTHSKLRKQPALLIIWQENVAFQNSGGLSPHTFPTVMINMQYQTDRAGRQIEELDNQRMPVNTCWRITAVLSLTKHLNCTISTQCQQTLWKRRNS